MEREEGELSDEDLEDVSDNSSVAESQIIIPGKSQRPLSSGREPFRELSLTSISDVESEDRKPVVKRSKIRLIQTRIREVNRDIYLRHKYRRSDRTNTNTKRLRRISERVIRKRNNSLRKPARTISTSSDESDLYTQDKKILRQLRDAVRINTSQNLPNCSLRTRLKRMIEPDSQGSKNSNSEDDHELELLRDQALQSKARTDETLKSDKDDEIRVVDDDLIKLRLVALQSAVLKKHQNRRKRKEEQQKLLEQQQTTDKDELNLANDLPNDKQGNDDAVETNLAIENVNESANTAPAQEVVDTQLPNEIIHNDNPNTPDSDLKTVDEDEDILRAMLLTSIAKKISAKKSVKQLNTSLNKAIPLSNKPNFAVKTLKKTNELKNQMKLSVPINRFVINVNSDDSDSDCDQTLIENKKAPDNSKNKDLFDKSLSLFLQQARANSEKDTHLSSSDIAKHLPRSQQLEYKRLKRQLQLMKMKSTPKPKKLVKNTPDENLNKKFKIGASSVTKRNFLRNKFASINNNNNAFVNPSSFKRKPVSQMDSYRLQMEGKYEELEPLMQRVAEALSARDKARAEVDRLINDVRIARADLTTSHQTYTVLMQQLVKAKSNIDKRLDKQEQNIKKTDNNKTSVVLSTSTPKKIEKNEMIPCETSSIIEPAPVEQAKENVHQPNENVPDSQGVEKNEEEINRLEMNILETPDQVQVQMMEIDEDDDDDNDDVRLIEEKEDKDGDTLNNIRNYTSPLDHIQLNREENLSNPLLVLCPYDLLGVCRDADCAFRHCTSEVTKTSTITTTTGTS